MLFVGNAKSGDILYKKRVIHQADFSACKPEE
jgi:hypothetical protein